MNRKNLLSQALNKNFSPAEIEALCNYELTTDEVNFVRDTAKKVLSMVKPKPLDSALLSSLIVAYIQDNSQIPVALLGGELHYKGNRIFTIIEDLNLNNSNEDIINKKFNNHHWVELGGLILDSSIFRTLYSNHTSEDLRTEIELKFGKNKDFTFKTPEQMQQNDLEYIPTCSLSSEAIDGLIEDFLNIDSIKL